MKINYGIFIIGIFAIAMGFLFTSNVKDSYEYQRNLLDKIDETTNIEYSYHILNMGAIERINATIYQCSGIFLTLFGLVLLYMAKEKNQ
jgi:hypothetical membrane protein